MSPQEREDARVSVQSLVNDLRHVVGNVPEADWPDTARSVLEYHEPPVDHALLTADQAELQKWCRAVLEGLLTGDEESTRAAALKVRQYEHSVEVDANTDA